MLKVVKNAHVVTERGIIWDGAIVIENGKIKAFGEEKDVKIPENAEIIDEVTFNRTFDQMINNMRYKHMQEML